MFNKNCNSSVAVDIHVDGDNCGDCDYLDYNVYDNMYHCELFHEDCVIYISNTAKIKRCASCIKNQIEESSIEDEEIYLDKSETIICNIEIKVINNNYCSKNCDYFMGKCETVNHEECDLYKVKLHHVKCHDISKKIDLFHRCKKCKNKQSV